MGYDISLVDRKTRETVLLKNAFYKKGNNVRANVDYLPPHARDFSRELGGYSIFQL